MLIVHATELVAGFARIVVWLTEGPGVLRGSAWLLHTRTTGATESGRGES